MPNNDITQPTRPGAIDKTSGTASGFPDFAWEHDNSEKDSTPGLTLKDPWHLNIESNLNIGGNLTVDGTFPGHTVPIGSVLAWTTGIAPVGYLLNDGTSYLRATYSDLFDIIGTTYGSVDGTHFNVPKSDYETGWTICTAWTLGNSITINHGMNTIFDQLEGQIYIRDPAVPGKIYNVTDFDFYTVTMYGERLNGIDGDLDNCYLQIASTSA